MSAVCICGSWQVKAAKGQGRKARSATARTKGLECIVPSRGGSGHLVNPSKRTIGSCPSAWCKSTASRGAPTGHMLRVPTLQSQATHANQFAHPWSRHRLRGHCHQCPEGLRWFHTPLAKCCDAIGYLISFLPSVLGLEDHFRGGCLRESGPALASC